MKTLLSFDELHDDEFVFDQYAPKGVTFYPGDLANTRPGVAHSGSVYIVPWRGEFLPSANFVSFFQPILQERVALYAGTEEYLGRDTSTFGVLHAYGIDGMLITADGPKNVQQGHCGTHFEVKTPNGKNLISFVNLDIFAFDGDGIASNPIQAIDDLEFESNVRDYPILSPIFKDPRYLYDPLWWLKTLWGRIDPSGPPYARAFVAARDLAHLAKTVDQHLRAEVTESAMKQGAVALALIKQRE